MTNARTVTLLLKGGHALRLDGVTDIDEFVVQLQHAKGELIEIRTQTSDRLVIRDDSISAILETADGARQPDSRTHIVIENFLSPEDHRTVISRILQIEASFKPSQVTTGRDDYRKSLSASEDEDIGPLFRRVLKKTSFAIAQSFGLDFSDEPHHDQIECQITAHGDGGFFHAHSDNGDPSTSSRLLSYVYYFRARPNGFFGGELKLYKSLVEHGRKLISSEYDLIPPKDNSIVFFPSAVWHEVLPTYVPSGEFRDSRFTVNGWIRLTVP